MLPLSGETVLIVEDDDATRELYRQALIIAGYRVLAARDGVDALRLIESDTAHAVVLDLMLPRLGGIDVYRELRAHDETRDIPVIIVTGSDSRELEPFDSRFFLRKPISPESLAYIVNDALRWPRGTVV